MASSRQSRRITRASARAKSNPAYRVSNVDANADADARSQLAVNDNDGPLNYVELDAQPASTRPAKQIKASKGKVKGVSKRNKQKPQPASGEVVYSAGGAGNNDGNGVDNGTEVAYMDVSDSNMYSVPDKSRTRGAAGVDSSSMYSTTSAFNAKSHAASGSVYSALGQTGRKATLRRSDDGSEYAAPNVTYSMAASGGAPPALPLEDSSEDDFEL